MRSPCCYSRLESTLLEDLAKGANHAFYFDEGPKPTPKLSVKKTWLKKLKDQKTLFTTSIIKVYGSFLGDH